MSSEEEKKRKAAARRLKAQRDFWALLGVMVIVWLITWGIWGLSGGFDGKTAGYWPLWVMFGTGIAVLFSGWNAFGPRSMGPTDAQIDAEVKKMGG